MTWIHLPHRSLVRVSGPDRCSFLQGLLTNDINQLSPDKPLYAALLTPQGKFLHDLFLTEDKEAFLLEGEKDRLSDLIKRLTLFKLRADVAFTPLTDLCVLAGLPSSNHEDICSSFEDPRQGVPWQRAYILKQELNTLGHSGDFSIYEKARLTLGVPEGSQDMAPDKAIPLECGLGDLGAISWDKGCYMGQELTARTKHRGLVRKRFLPFSSRENLHDAVGKSLLQGEKKVGTVLSAKEQKGLARLRLEALDLAINTGDNNEGAAPQHQAKLPITLDGNTVDIHIPEWVRL